MVRNYSKARDAYGEAMEVDTGNDCLVALMLSNRAATFQKQREEAMECEVLLSKAEKECEEAQEALLLAQRRLIKGHETLQLYQRRDARIRKEFIEDEEKALLDPGVDPSPPHLLGPDGKPNSVCRGRWALCKAIEDACAALDRDPNCAPALVHRSRSYKEVGDLTEAVSDMERALNSTDRLVGHEGMEPAVLRSELREAQRQLTAAPIDHYKVLGLGGGGPTITADAIKKAYRRMAIKYHPDKQAHLGGEERGRMERRFKQISEANQVLGDATERRLFDMRRARRGATFPRYGGGSSYSRGFGNSNRSPYDDDDDDLSGF
ncbi:DnaJ domain-containing protein [Baffinella frigidus]|nr:DnaJ domain-containing protein [Cryptophyta sp. CCMP2293]